MRILVCGASGFIGQAVTLALRTAGHEVLRGVRSPQHAGDIRIDYTADIDAANWRSRLDGIEAVVNAVGIITERPDATFENLHERAPIALFEACARSTVWRVLQVSALGAGTGDTGYFRSKRAADLALMRLPLGWQILRPSLVYGDRGASASAFRTLSSLPLIPIPALPPSAQFQPVHIDDLAAAIVIALDRRTPPRQCLDCVGSTRHTFRQMLSSYRDAFGLGPVVWLPIPAAAMAVAARVASLIPNVPLTPETWRMLKQGNAADPGAFAQLLGRAPQGLCEFIPVTDAERLCARAMSTWQLPLLRVSLAAVWILSGIVSAFLYPRSASLALLAPLGLTGALAIAALYSASVLDVALGVATLLYPRRITWIAQALLIVGYSLTIAVAMPNWLLHPFAPVLKNLPMLAVLAVLLAKEPPCSTSR